MCDQIRHFFHANASQQQHAAKQKFKKSINFNNKYIISIVKQVVYPILKGHVPLMPNRCDIKEHLYVIAEMLRYIVHVINVSRVYLFPHFISQRKQQEVKKLLVITRTWLRYVRVFAIASPSVHRLPETFVRPTQGLNFRQYFFAILYLSHRLTLTILM